MDGIQKGAANEYQRCALLHCGNHLRCNSWNFFNGCHVRNNPNTDDVLERFMMMDTIKNVLGALCVMIIFMAICSIAIWLFGLILGFSLWFFMCLTPTFVINALKIVASLIVIGIFVAGFYGAYQLVDEWRRNQQ